MRLNTPPLVGYVTMTYFILSALKIVFTHSSPDEHVLNTLNNETTAKLSGFKDQVSKLIHIS